MGQAPEPVPGKTASGLTNPHNRTLGLRVEGGWWYQRLGLCRVTPRVADLP